MYNEKVLIFRCLLILRGYMTIKFGQLKFQQFKLKNKNKDFISIRVKKFGKN